MMLLVFISITFVIQINGQSKTRSLSLTTAIIDYLNKNNSDSLGPFMESILAEPVLYPSIIRKLAEENRTISWLQYLSKHSSLDLFKSLVVLDDYPTHDEQAISDAWKCLKLLVRSTHQMMSKQSVLYVTAYNKNNSKKLHVTMNTTTSLSIHLNYSNQSVLSSAKDVMEWSHIPSFLTTLTVTISGTNRYIDLDLRSFDPSCKLTTLVIIFRNGWVHFPDYSFPPSLKNLVIRGDITWPARKADYRRLWKIGSSIQYLQLNGMRMDLTAFDGFENMIHLRALYVNAFPAHSIHRLATKLKLLNRLCPNSLRTERTLLFYFGEINTRLITFNYPLENNILMIARNSKSCRRCWAIGIVCTIICCVGLLTILWMFQ
eukprot:326660_1